MKLKIALIVMIITQISCISVKDFDPYIKGLSQSKELDEGTIIKGLKEALSLGTEKAVDLLSRNNGYLKNAAVYIPLPEELKDIDKALRNIGLGKEMDRFIEDMNHAAEEGARKAVEIFVKAITEMTLNDARNILQGHHRAATEYFEGKTRGQLYGLFFPVIKKTLDNLGVTKLYKYLLDTYNAIPFVKKKSYAIDQYATDKALDGLFYMLGEEEKKIRLDPAARVTDLLRKVFG
ncbi:MAG: DUF4197 domain-containing protein [Spirochaetales bacterium]|nr:DUF4197 domain-containing protein [Spirochaetales bacterium]